MLAIISVLTINTSAFAQGSTNVAPGLYRIYGYEPTLTDNSDLEPISRIVGGAKYVGLGESIHTSGGQYKLKHRIIKHLVENKGFRVLGWENPWIWSESITNYLETCSGDLDAVLRTSIFGTHQSEEVRDLLQWMCTWNAANPNDKVHFYGFDIQFNVPVELDRLFGFLNSAGIYRTDPLYSDVDRCDGAINTYFPRRIYPEAEYNACMAALSRIETYMETNHEALIEQRSETEFRWAKVSLVAVQSFQEELYYFFSDFTRSFNARDVGMAYLAREIKELKFGNAKTVLWAHNGHVMRDSAEALGGLIGAGTYLASDLDKKYVVIGLTAYQTYADTFVCGLWNPGGERPMEPPLHNLGYGSLLVDFTQKNHLYPPFESPERWSIGDFYQAPLSDGWDAIVSLEESPAMIPLFRAPCSF